MHWRKALCAPAGGNASSSEKQPESKGRVHTRLWVNGIGAAATGTALIIILAAKFVEGAWITIITIPLLLLLFHSIHRYYQRVSAQVTARRPLDLLHNPAPVVLVPMSGWNRITGKSLRFGLWLSRDVIGLYLSHLNGDEAEEDEQRVRKEWTEDVEAPAKAAGVAPPRLDVLQTPFREFTQPILSEVKRLQGEFPGRPIAVMVPELVALHWWQKLLHSRRAAKLRSASASAVTTRSYWSACRGTWRTEALSTAPYIHRMISGAEEVVHMWRSS